MSPRTGTTGRSVVSKAAVILLSFLNGASYSPTEIAATTGLPSTTARRLIRELAAWKILECTDEGAYRLGRSLQLIGYTSGRIVRFYLREYAQPLMQDLSEAFNTQVRLGVLRNCEVLYIEMPPGERSATNFSSAASLPVHATAMGKVLLAFSPSSLVDAIVARGLPAYTPLTLTAPAQLRRALARARVDRFAVSHWWFRQGHSSLAVPIFSPRGAVTAALELRVDDLTRMATGVRPALSVAGSSLTSALRYSALPSQGIRSVL